LSSVFEVGNGVWSNGDSWWAGWNVSLCALRVSNPSVDHTGIDLSGITSPFLGELGIFIHPAGSNGVDVGLIGLNGSVDVTSDCLGNFIGSGVHFLVVSVKLLINSL
jgi:hypothetical protein